MTEVREAVAGAIEQILADKDKPAPRLENGQTLMGDLGLDSLDLAVLVVKLETRLGVDPFREGRAPVATFGELVQVYRDAIAD